MALLVAAGTAYSVAANSVSGELVAGSYQFAGKGKVTLVAKSSATGMYATLLVGGIALCQGLPIPFTGTAGTISSNDNIVASQVMNGGKIEFSLANRTAGALTTDYLIYLDPMGK